MRDMKMRERKIRNKYCITFISFTVNGLHDVAMTHTDTDRQTESQVVDTPETDLDNCEVCLIAPPCNPRMALVTAMWASTLVFNMCRPRA